jgi:hypothetical protein
VELHKYSTGNFVTRHKIIDKPHINVINDLLNPHGSDETIKAQKNKKFNPQTC